MSGSVHKRSLLSCERAVFLKSGIAGELAMPELLMTIDLPLALSPYPQRQRDDTTLCNIQSKFKTRVFVDWIGGSCDNDAPVHKRVSRCGRETD